MNDDFDVVSQKILQAVVCEDIFGTLNGTSDEKLSGVKKTFRAMARVVHPDYNSANKKIADDSSAALTKFYHLAVAALEEGTYGQRIGETTMKPVQIKIRNREYTIISYLTTGDICTLYRCEFFDKTGTKTPGVIKISRQVADNDLVANEARILKRLVSDEKDIRLHPLFPVLRDSFLFKNADSSPPLRANVLILPSAMREEIAQRGGDVYSLKEVRNHYGDRLDPADMVWMWRRLLLALGAAHVHRIVHGAVLPSHILIQPESHGLMLIDWSYAVLDPASSGERISAISREYETWYPKEVMSKGVPSPSTDIYMGAKAMVYLVGGDPITGTFPSSVPIDMQRYFNACLNVNSSSRPQDTLGLLREFEKLRDRLYGPPKFRTFSMPSKT